MQYNTHLLKMRTEYDYPVRYYLQTEAKNDILMNNQIGKRLNIHFQGKIHCINCGAETNKSFHQGYCYQCFTTLPQTDVGILNPEKDMSHKGISRDMEWAKENSLVDHIVYLSVTSNLKVGVTRYTQVPTRWIDQGAISAIKLARTPNRHLAGLIEVSLKAHISDKTNWKEMLVANSHQINLKNEKQRVSQLIPEDLRQYITIDNFITEIEYSNKPKQVNYAQLNLEKEPDFSDILVGIKGQYLMFENGKALNVRRHNGYLVNIEFS